MAHVDFKITTWERIELEESQVEQVKKLIEEGKVNSANDMWDYFEDIDCFKLAEVDEPMTVEDNQGNPTIELFNDEAETVCTNVEGYLD